MSDLAPSPSSSSSGEDNGSDNSNGAPPPPGSSSSSRSPSNSKGESSQSPPSPSSGGSRSSSPSDSQDSSSSGPPFPSEGSPPSSQQLPKSPPSSSNGANSNSSPPSSPPSNSSPNESSSNSSQNSGNSNSSPPPGKSSSPPQRSGGSLPSPPFPSSSQSPPTESDEASSSPRAPPPRSSPSSPKRSHNDESSSQPSPRTPTSSSPSPPPPTNQSVVFVPVPVLSNGPPGALPPPGSAAISPGSSVTSTNLPSSTPSSQVASAGSQQVAGSSGASNSGDGSSTNSDTSQSSLASSRVGTSHVTAAIAGATITGLTFVVVAVFLVVWRRKKKRSPDGIVYHSDGSYYVHSGQLGDGANQSGMHPPSGASAGFSYGSASGADNAAAGGYYQSGIMESKSSFSYEELTSITSNFSRDNVIGEGGFGCVYKGWLADGKCVAVKQLKAGSGQGEREFQAEVEIISRVHHRHLVSLVGYCVAAHHRMLVYEFVPNGTLEHHLHGRGVLVMDWPTRLRIAIGAAKGLAYLHEDCHPRIIHRDIKSANILLDYSFEAQVADFGLAKLSSDTHTHVSTRIMGTFGYLAPEYASSGKLTDRSDVFSFGVVLLELITGRKPVDQTRALGEESLVEWARPVLADAVETGDLDALVDPRLEGAYNRGEMVVMVEAAAACVRHSAPKRPRMVQVMRALDDDAGGMSDLSNGVKVGQSRAYGSGNHVAAIQQLRLTAFASEEFTGEFEQTREYGGGTDSETQPMNRRLG